MSYMWKEHRFRLSQMQQEVCVHGKQESYSINHQYRSKKGPFNGKLENHIAPKIVKVSNIFVEIEGNEENWGKSESKKRKKNIKKVKT